MGRDLLNVSLVRMAALDDSSVESVGGLMILDFRKLLYLPITKLFDLILVIHDGFHAVEFVILQELTALLLTIDELRPVFMHLLRGSLSL